MGRTVKLIGRALFLCAAGAWAACSPNAGQTFHAPAVAAATYHGPTGTASITFTIPPPASAALRRAPKYVSPASATLDVIATNGVDVVPTTGISLAGLCTASGSSRACTVSVPAPIGNDTFTVTLKDGSGHVLSTKVTTTAVAIAEGATNVLAPLVLDPVASTLTITYGASSPATTNGLLVSLGAADAATMPIGGIGTFVDSTDTATPLTITTLGTTSGVFSASSTCSPTAATFSPWTTTSALYFCPNGAQTLGSLYTLTLGTATTTFATRRTGLSTSSALPAEPNPGMGFTVALDVSGDDALSTFAVTGFDIGYHELEIGSYSTAAAWQACPNGAYQYSVPLLAKGGTRVIAAAETYSRLDQFTIGGSCTASGLSLATTADVGAMTNDPSSTTTAYAVATDDYSVGKVIAFNDATMVQSGSATPNCQPAVPPSFPHSLAVGPGGTLYVGCDNGTTVNAYQTQPSFSASATLIPTALGPYVSADVAASLDIAYAAVSGGGAVRIYELANGNATLVYTLASASDVVYGYHGLAVGNDDRLYLALANSGTYRVVAFDPYSNTLTDPAIVIGSSLQTNSPIELSVGQAGKIIVSGLRPDMEVGGAYWPN